MTAIDVKFADVLTAARRAVNAADGDGWWSSWELPDMTARYLGIQDARNNPGTSLERSAAGSFDSQVSRAFNRLADEGMLVKVGRGEVSPSGSTLGNESQFWLPAAYEEAVERARRGREQVAADTLRMQSVNEGLEEAGFRPRNARENHPVLSLEDWEQLLARIRTTP